MQNIKRTSSKKKAVIILVAVIIAAASGIAVFALTRPANESSREVSKPANTIDYDAPSEEQKQAGTDAKKDFIERTDKEANEEAQQSTVSSASFTSINQEGATLRIRTVISSNKEGVCTLTLERSGQSKVTQEAATQDMGSYSTCKGFDIDVSGLAKGRWNVSLRFSGDAVGAAVSDVMEIK